MPHNLLRILLPFLMGLQLADAAAAAPPNIIVIFTDDHGYADLGVQGVFDDVKTPHIDALARGGVRMTDGYVTAPQCVPSRGGLITGQYQSFFGLESNTQFRNADVMRRFDEIQTIPERLREAGYATGMAGKWHLGDEHEIVRHGFDQALHKNSGRPGIGNMDLKGNDIPLPDKVAGKEGKGQKTQSGKNEPYHLDMIADFATAFIDRHHERPFFFYLAPRAPHVPLDPPPSYLDRFPGKMPERRRKALAMISAIDDGVGKIMATLREHNLEENTLIFVISDNGAPLKIHKEDAPGGGPGWDGSLNDPLNGEKGMLSEGGIRTPHLMVWKGTLPAGKVYPRPVISLDVAATANALAGLPDDEVLTGVNLIPYLTGEKTGDPHDVLFWRWLGQSAIRKGDWKYLRLDDREYLYDLATDIGETRNLIGERREIADGLLAELREWADTLAPPGLGALRIQGLQRNAEKYFDHYMDKPAPSETVEP